MAPEPKESRASGAQCETLFRIVLWLLTILGIRLPLSPTRPANVLRKVSTGLVLAVFYFVGILRLLNAAFQFIGNTFNILQWVSQMGLAITVALTAVSAHVFVVKWAAIQELILDVSGCFSRAFPRVPKSIKIKFSASLFLGTVFSGVRLYTAYMDSEHVNMVRLFPLVFFGISVSPPSDGRGPSVTLTTAKAIFATVYSLMVWAGLVFGLTTLIFSSLCFLVQELVVRFGAMLLRDSDASVTKSYYRAMVTYHTRLLAIVDKLEGAFSLLLFLWVSQFVVSSITMLAMFVGSRKEVGFLEYFFSATFFFDFFVLFQYFLPAADILHAWQGVHYCLQRMLATQLKSDSRAFRDANFLMQKVSGTPFHLTCFDLFVFSRQAFVSILGSLGSYAAIVYQFTAASPAKEKPQ